MSKAKWILEGITKQSITIGASIEQEHKETLTKLLKIANPNITQEVLENLLIEGYELIAEDHLKERPDYYELLVKFVEKK